MRWFALGRIRWRIRICDEPTGCLTRKSEVTYKLESGQVNCTMSLRPSKETNLCPSRFRRKEWE